MILSGGGGDAPILKVGFQWLGNGSPEGPGGGGAIAGPGGAGDDAASREKLRREKADTDNLAKMKKTGMSHFRTTFGINIGIAAILKQSQIFTGTIGSLFQILGAFIDIILAAFMPIIIPAIKLLVKLMPYIRVAARNIIGNLVKLWFGIAKLLDKINILNDGVKSILGKGFMTVFAHLLVITFMARLFGMQKTWFTFLKFTILNPIKYLLRAILVATIGRAVGRFAPGLASRFRGQTDLQRANAAFPVGGGGGGFRGTKFGGNLFGRVGAGGAGFGALAGIPSIIGGIGDIQAGNKGKGTGRMIGGVAGGAAGGALGAALGSIVPGPGTVIGGMAGAAAGAWLGDMLGGKLGEAIANEYTSAMTKQRTAQVPVSEVDSTRSRRLTSTRFTRSETEYRDYAMQFG